MCLPCAQILLDDLESWMDSNACDKLRGKTIPSQKEFFFFCVYRISIHVLSMLFSHRRIKKSELFYSYFTFHILPSFWGVSIIFYLPSSTQGPPRPRQALSMLEDYWATDSVNPDRVRFHLKGPFAADRDPGYQPLGI